MLLVSGSAFSQYTFGPGDPAFDCGNGSLGTSVFANPGTYTWQGAPLINYNNSGGAGTFGFNCIEVTSSDVIIDCDGGTLDGSAADSGEIGIYLDEGISNVTIRDCTVRDFGWSFVRPDIGNVFINGTDDVSVVNSNITYTGASPSLGDCLAYSTANAEGLLVNNSNISRTAGVGATDESGIGSRDSAGNLNFARVSDVTLINSNFDNHDGMGVAINGYDLYIDGSSFGNNVMSGLYFSDSAAGVIDEIRRSNFNANGDYGIELVDARQIRISYNNVTSNTESGLEGYYLNDSIIMRNNFSLNAKGVGIFDSNSTTVRNNAIEDNTETGLIVSNGSLSGNCSGIDLLFNNLSGNSIGIMANYTYDSNISGNNISSSTNDGMVLRNVDPTTIADNRIVGSGDFGISACDLVNVSFLSNTVYNNNDDGIFITSCDLLVNENISFENNNISMNGNNGVNAEFTDYLYARENDFFSNLDNGLNLGSWVYAPVVSDNVFYGNSRGLFLGQWCDDGVVYGNNLTLNSPVGMEAASVFNLEVYNNDFYLNGGGPAFYIPASDTVNIHDNLFHNNEYGVYSDSGSSSINVTDNVFTYDLALLSESIHFSNVFDGLMEGNEITNSTAPGAALYATLSDGLDMLNNEITLSSGVGIYLDSSDSCDLFGNTVANSTLHGLYIEDSDYLDIEQCEISGNLRTGLHFDNSDYPVLENNDIFENHMAGVNFTGGSDLVHASRNSVYDNNLSGYFLNAGSDHALFEDEVLYGNGLSGTALTPESYSLYAFDSENITINRTTQHSSYGGFYFSSSQDVFVDNTESYNTVNDAFWFEDVDGFELTKSEAYNCGFGIYCDGTSTGIIRDSYSHDHSAGVYGIEVLDTSYINASNLRLYGNDAEWLVVHSSSRLNATDLWIGNDNRTGILWPSVDIDDSTNLRDSNILLGGDFVSLNSSDSNAEEMNVSATVSLGVGGCSGLAYYEEEGFPGTRAEIISDGTSFLPTGQSCLAGVATFDVESFSGYTASGFSPSGGGDEDKNLQVDHTKTCPEDNVELLASHSTEPVSNVEVKVIKYTPYGGVVSEGYTDDAGRYTFSPEHTATYRIYVSKGGYSFMNPYVIDYELCSGEAEDVGCSHDRNCADDEMCSGGTCVPVTGECGYASGHAWISYECCSDADCEEGKDCVDNICMTPEEQARMDMPELTSEEEVEAVEEAVENDTYEEEQPQDGESPPEEEEESASSEEEALAAIDDAAQAIQEADNEGKDTEEARQVFSRAQAAFEAGDYEGAIGLADEARMLAESAVADSGVNGEDQAEPEDEPPAQDGGGLGIVAILLVLVVLAALAGGAYWFFLKENK
jgi:parallel beta-helix repeat protein